MSVAVTAIQHLSRHLFSKSTDTLWSTVTLLLTTVMISFVLFMLFTLGEAFPPLDNVVLKFPSSDIPFPIYDTIEVGIAFNMSMHGVQQSAFTSVLLPSGTLQSVGSINVSCDGVVSEGNHQFMVFLQGIYTIFWNVTHTMSSDPFQANSSSCGPGPYSTQSWLLNSTFTANYDGTTSVPPSLMATRTLSSEPTGSVSIANPPLLNESNSWDQMIAEEAAAFSQVVFTKFTQFSPATLLIYDILLTLDEEIQLVWRGTWGVPVFIYLTNRYGVLVQTLGLSALILADELIGNWLVPAFNFWLTLSVPVVILMIEAMITMRVIALYENSRMISVSLWGLYICTGAASFTVMGIDLATIAPVTTVYEDSVTGASFTMFLQANTLFGAAWVPGLVMELVLVILTVIRGVRHRRAGVMAPLLSILVRDGVVYFVVVFALMLCNLLISLYAYLILNSSLNNGTIVQLTLCVASILCSRLFLNLRRAAYELQIQTSQLSPAEPRDMYTFGRGSESLDRTAPSLLGTLGGYSEEYR